MLRREGLGAQTSTVDEDLPIPEPAVLAVLYAPGQRPSIDAVRLAGEASGAFALSFDPRAGVSGGGDHGLTDHSQGDGTGWAELLITGLTFDVAGLAPGPAETMPSVAQRYGLADNLSVEGLEAVLVQPGAHLAGAAGMLPVVRGCVAMGAALATHTDAAAVVWIPARTAMATDYFSATIGDWLGGGAFPALGLTSLVPGGSGITSEGLTFFTGQELEVAGSDLADTGRIAVRMVHTLVGHGRLAAPTQLAGPEGEPLQAEPSDDGKWVRVWSQS